MNTRKLTPEEEKALEVLRQSRTQSPLVRIHTYEPRDGTRVDVVYNLEDGTITED